MANCGGRTHTIATFGFHSACILLGLLRERSVERTKHFKQTFAVELPRIHRLAFKCLISGFHQLCVDGHQQPSHALLEGVKSQCRRRQRLVKQGIRGLVVVDLEPPEMPPVFAL